MTVAPTPLGLALVGARGTGKSTVGRWIARAVSLPFIDADAALEAHYGRTIRAIFEDDGEPTFRDLEERTIASITAGPPVILATGGGVILREANRSALRRFGKVVWLRASPETLNRRLRADTRRSATRPALTSLGTLGEIEAVLQARTPLYRDLADWIVDTDAISPEEVAQVVLRTVARDWPVPLSLR